MEHQTTFADLQSASRHRMTKRDALLRETNTSLFWDHLIAIVKPSYYPGQKGRLPIGIERML